MSAPPRPADPVWGRESGQLRAIVRNVGSRYAVLGVDASIGLLLLPFNIHHLGQTAWGLWMLTASLNSYFTVMELGYGGAVTKFVAQYRALRDARSINEIVSTLAVVFAGAAVIGYAVFVVVAFNVSRIFNLTPDQVGTARALLLFSGAQVALGFPFGVFGGVVNGFQRYDLNNAISIATSVAVAVVNVGMLVAGFGLVELVGATTAVRIASNFLYRINAYRVFPSLSVRPSQFRVARLREASGFSAYIAIINWSNRLNYATDALVIGAFLSPAAVAVWAVPRRLVAFVQSATGQLTGVLLPVVVDTDARRRAQDLRKIFVHGTRLCLVAVAPLAAALFMTADAVIPAWVGPGFEGSVPIARILVLVIALRVGNATATVLLKGAGEHRVLAFNNAAVALANLALSILWIRGFGLVGVAFGTLLPLAAGSILNLWPRTCQRVGLRPTDAFRRTVWPAVWPLAWMVAVVAALRAIMPPGPLPALVSAAAGVICYAVITLAFAMSRHERATYLAKAMLIVRRPQRKPARA